MELDVKLDAQLLQNGLEFALKGGARPLLCMVAPDMLRLAVRYEEGILLSWEQPFPWDVKSTSAFIIPSKVARMLAYGGLEDVHTLNLWAAGEEARFRMGDGEIETEIQWQWAPSLLGAPDELETMLVPPRDPIPVSHRALAALIEEKRGDGAPVTIVQIAPTLRIDGERVGAPDGPGARFDPHALAQVLDLIDGDEVLIKVNGAFLVVVGRREGWRTQCALRAITKEDADHALPEWQQAPEVGANRDRPLDVMRLALLDTIETLEEPDPDISA